MSEKDFKVFATSCVNCDHPEIRHMKQSSHFDEQNWKKLARDKPVHTDCKDCTEKGEKCKGFKPKKKSLFGFLSRQKIG